jgi:hypothetical protein
MKIMRKISICAQETTFAGRKLSEGIQFGSHEIVIVAMKITKKLKK